jgi:putative transposase
MVDRRLGMKAMDAALSAGVRIDDVTAFCREHGVSTRTFYRHRQRIRVEQVWRQRSRRPRHSPSQAPPELDAWICKLRAELAPDNGADFIRDALIDIAATSPAIGSVTSPATGSGWSVPSRSTINRVLARHDLLDRNPAKRPRSSWRRFTYARPRDCYQIDATMVAVADRGLVAVFDVIDDCTRMLVACHAAAAETTDAAIDAITAAFHTYGAPGLVLADNGAAFTHRFIHPDTGFGGGISRFARTVTDHGTRLIHSSPYHPQTCGKVERHHQTLKRWLANHPTPTSIDQLQTLLDSYRDHYNHHRRHSAIGRRTPHHAWTTAPHHGGPTSLPIQTDATVHRLHVTTNGTITLGRHRISVGRPLTGTTVTVIRNHHHGPGHSHATVYTPNGDPIGHATLNPDRRYTPLTRT